MTLGVFTTPQPLNEPVLDYAPGSSERANLIVALEKLKSEPVEIPLIIGGKEVRTGRTEEVRSPHNHEQILGRCHMAGEAEVHQAIEAAIAAQAEWAAMPWEARAAIFLKMAELLAGPYRGIINAATMLGQSKSAYQAEIDAACELIDFLRFNAHYMEQIYCEQPQSSPGVWNRMEHRPLEGFIFAVTPFNFTAIAGNLCTAPGMMGNVVLWKPTHSAILSAYWLTRIFHEAGLPDGVINFLPGRGPEVGTPAMASPHLAGVHFTGSTRTFKWFLRTLGENVDVYRSYPRVVGETGGKDFVFVHDSADLDEVSTAIVRGAFEYQGQKCSAASRCYVPDTVWPELKKKILDQVETLKMGDVEDFSCFVNAVIDRASFDNIKGYIDAARDSDNATIIAGGGCDDAKGFFVEPTVIETRDPLFQTMQEEIFGPVVTIYVYPAEGFSQALELCDSTSPYALTGAIFARDRAAIVQATRALVNAAGNFYINDKPTGAVVGQQPFGGGRLSGTNDKAGSILNMLRWVSPRSIKETFVPPKSYEYPYMDAE